MSSFQLGKIGNSPDGRYAFEGKCRVQMFFCFVDKTGPFAEFKYDKRNVIVEEVEL